MSHGNDNEKILRKFEREVLDAHHESLPLWKRDRHVAVYGALAQFDCNAILTFFFPSDMHGLGQMQILKNVEEGLSQGIMWLATGQKTLDLKPTDDPAIIEEAGEFCGFAAQYVNIADFHKMYGRGQVELEIDAGQRKVRFVTPRGNPPVAALLGMAEQSHQLSKLPVHSNSSENEKLGKDASDFLKKAELHYNSGRVELVDVLIANDERIVNQLKWGLPDEVYPLDDEDDLVGFTVREFGSYYRALQRWSFCCTFGFLHSVTELGKQQWECTATQSVERSRFIQSMSQLAELSDETIAAITNRLSFDDRTKSPDVFQQPLFCGPTTVSWSCSVVQNSRFLRNMLKLMSRTKQLQNHAATLIGSRESKMLGRLGDMLSRRGKTDYKLTTPISDGTDKGEIDLLAYNKKFPDQVLIVEGKALLGVDEINEVDAGTKEMQSGQGQLREAMRILSNLSDAEKGSLFKFVNWPVVTKIYGVVVAAESEPNDKFDHSQIPGISLQTISARLRDNHFSSPAKFWQACKDRRWMGKLNTMEESHKAFRVGDVTYELPVLVESEAEVQRKMFDEMERLHRPHPQPQRKRRPSGKSRSPKNRRNR